MSTINPHKSRSPEAAACGKHLRLINDPFAAGRETLFALAATAEIFSVSRPAFSAKIASQKNVCARGLFNGRDYMEPLAGYKRFLSNNDTGKVLLFRENQIFMKSRHGFYDRHHFFFAARLTVQK